MFQANLFPQGSISAAVKEVSSYRAALKRGWDLQREQGGFITNNVLIEVFQVLKNTGAGFRTLPGTALYNEAAGQTVYVPPQEESEIIDEMRKLERFINDDEISSLDPLVKMALIHHQFESIHPFSDGNGRLGRILNVLYLTRTGLLDIPILYLSRTITRTKGEYYRLLQAVRDEGAWEEWVLYMVNAVSETAQSTLKLVEDLNALMTQYKERIREELPKIYSQELLNNLFRHPYTRIEYVQEEVGVTRQTASKYLEQLADINLVVKHQVGRNNYYINTPLVGLLMHVSER